MTLSSMNSSPTTLKTVTSSAMRSQREHRSFSEDWKVIKIQRELDDEWCLIFDLYLQAQPVLQGTREGLVNHELLHTLVRVIFPEYNVIDQD